MPIGASVDSYSPGCIAGCANVSVFQYGIGLLGLKLIICHSGDALGDGANRCLVREAVRLAVCDTRLWEPRDRYSSILFYHSRHSSPSRVLQLKTCGFLSLMHMVATLTGPDPISPFLIRAAIEGRAGTCIIDHAFLRLLSPQTLASLTPFTTIDSDVEQLRNPLNPAGGLLLAANINVCRRSYLGCQCISPSHLLYRLHICLHRLLRMSFSPLRTL